MSDSNKRPSDSETRVDLGDDLLEKTTTRISADAKTLSPAELLAKLEDLLQSARILLNEGLTEEAKKVYRQILIADPANAFAQRGLQEIHELELKQILSAERRARPRSGPDTDHLYVDTERVLRELDHDMELGLSVRELSLFKDEEAMRGFVRTLESQLEGGSPRDRMDLGIAFSEMGLYELAVSQFKAAEHALATSGTSAIAALCLLSYALIQVGRPFEATLKLEEALRDTETRDEDRVELMYLMGRAYEALEKPDTASNWYRQVREADPYYRDAEERLRKASRR